MAQVLPKLPKIVVPKTLAPQDVTRALIDTAEEFGVAERDALEKLVRQPLAKVGITLPEPPATPGTMVAQLLKALPPIPTAPGAGSPRGEYPVAPPTKERFGRGSL